MLAASLAGCAASPRRIPKQVVAPGEKAIELGTPVRDNLTPMEGALACFARVLAQTRRQPLVIGVGEVKDYTGRYAINEGNAITQGGSLMLYSALAKLGGTVRVAERFDPSIAERELAYMDRRQLGNGEQQQVNGQTVPWLPYFGGSIQVSDYYIVGGITEVNYNISSGGFEASVNNIGAKQRTYTQSVAIDLRIVDSRSLLVVDSVSLSKQFTGYEVGANTFRFFGLSLFDINVGEKAQEPLQLGIRAAIEEASVRLIGRVADVDSGFCLGLATKRIQTRTAEEQFKLAAEGKLPALVEAAGRSTSRTAEPKAKKKSDKANAKPSRSLNEGSGDGSAQSASDTAQVGFDVGNPALVGGAMAIIDKIPVAVKSAPVTLVLVARERENLDPAQRARLLDQRIDNLLTALANRGIPPANVTITWRPERTDATIYRGPPGLQIIARLKVGG
jgi:curli biogenesis system outer membrane secretion channel CsgG